MDLRRSFESFSREIFHSDVPVLVIREIVVDAWEALVAQRRKMGDLAIVAVGGVDHFLQAEGLQVDLLNSDQAILMPTILRLVDRGKPALANLLENPVAPCEQKSRWQQAHSRSGSSKQGLIPTCVLRDTSKMREVSHRSQTFRIGFQLIESITYLVNHLIERGQSQIRQMFFAHFFPYMFHEDSRSGL